MDDECCYRITEGPCPPTAEDLARWLGPEPFGLWERLVGYIDETYPGVFIPDWLYGGKHHGWSLRYKKGRSFCTLIPEKGKWALLVVFGAAERARAEGVLPRISGRTRRIYEDAPTYHDGKWVFFFLNDPGILEDAKALLGAKRPPKPPQ